MYKQELARRRKKEKKTSLKSSPSAHLARAGVGVEDAAGAVGARGDQFGAGGVEGHVEDFVVVAPQGVHALAAGHVPYFTGAVDGPADAQVRPEVELRTRGRKHKI